MGLFRNERDVVSYRYLVHSKESACPECGFQVPACRRSAIPFAGNLAAARHLVDRGDVVLVLPSEAVVFFYPATPEQLFNGCVAAGFRSVFLELLGDELVAAEYLSLWRAMDGSHTWIRSTDSLVVERIRTDYPELLAHLAPVVTPAVASARHLRHSFPETPIAYAGVQPPGPEPTDEIDIAISLSQLSGLLKERGVPPQEQPHTLRCLPPGSRRYLSVPGALPRRMLDEQPLSSRAFMKLRGLHALPAVSRAIGDGRSLGFVDLLAYEGILDHPALGPRDELVWRRAIAELAEGRRADTPVVVRQEGVDLSARYGPASRPLESRRSDAVAILEEIETKFGDRPWDRDACRYLGGHYATAIADERERGASVCPYYIARQYDTATRDAAHDALTSLYSYGALQERLEEEIARADRTGSLLAMLFIDLDDFKQVNDLYGHPTGNEVLRRVAEAIRSGIRSTDLAARFGGDEFVVLLVNAERHGVERVAAELKNRIAALTVSVPEGDVRITASIGIAYHAGSPTAALGGQDLLAEADAAVYRAKAQGGNVTTGARG